MCFDGDRIDLRAVTMPCYNFCMSLTSDDLADVKQLMESVLSGHTAEINKRFDDVNKRLDGVDERLDGMDKRFDSINKRLDGMDKRFDDINKRLDNTDKRLDDMDERFDDINERLDSVDKRLDENEEIQNEILNAIGTDLNRHSARLDDYEDRLKKLERGVA